MRVFLHDGTSLTWLGECHWEGRVDRPIVAMQGEDLLEVYRCGKISQTDQMGQVHHEDAALLAPGQSPAHLADFFSVADMRAQMEEEQRARAAAFHAAGFTYAEARA